MWEETFDELEGESRPRSLVFNIPFLKERIDQIIVFLIIIGSALVLIVAIKLNLYGYWAGFLKTTKFLQIATYPLLISAVSVLAGLALQTALWIRYKPETLPRGPS